MEEKLKEINAAIEEIKKTFDASLENSASKKDLSEIKNQLDGIEMPDVDSVKTEITASINALKVEFQKQIDEVGNAITKIASTPKNLDSYDTFKEALKNALVSKEFKEFVEKGGSTRAIELKAAGDMGTGTNTSSNGVAPVILPDRRRNPVSPVDRIMNLREIMNIGTTTSDSIDYVKEANYEDGVAMTAELTAKGQSDFDLVEDSVKVETLATYFTVSNRMLADIAYLTSYITARATKKLYNKEDQQILFGTGTTPQLKGITVGATAFSAGNFANTISEANEYDVLRIAISNLTVGYYSATAVIMNPEDTAKMDLTKATDGQYIKPRFSEGQGGLITATRAYNGQMFIMGLPVIESTAMTAGKYLVGDFANGVELVYREGINVRFSDSHSDNFTKNKTTIRIEERLALPIYRDEAFVYGTFETDIAAILASS